MLESLSSAIERIDNIKSHFHSLRTRGVVGIAPHTVDGELGPREVVLPEQIQFANYMNDAINGVRGSSDVLASGDDGQYEQIIEQASGQWGIDSSLIKAVIRAESGFKSNAVSVAGAQGLMQLMPSTARSLGVSNPFDPEQNIMAGTRYLKGQLERFDNKLELALAAYNAGPGAVRKYGGVPPYSETQNYVKRVLGYKEQYSR